MTPDEIRASADRHRSPMVLQCMEDHLKGNRHDLGMFYIDPSITCKP
jgi:hypothetical protein